MNITSCKGLFKSDYLKYVFSFFLAKQSFRTLSMLKAFVCVNSFPVARYKTARKKITQFYILHKLAICHSHHIFRAQIIPNPMISILWYHFK